MPLGGCGRGGPSSSSPVGPVDGRPEQRALRAALLPAVCTQGARRHVRLVTAVKGHASRGCRRALAPGDADSCALSVLSGERIGPE